MIFHVSICLLAHEEKGLISNTFCHAKREYSFSVRPIGCTPAFSFCYHQIIQTLQKTKSVSTKTRKAVTTYVSDKTIEKIIKLLRCAFKQAVR